jgi:hypothetical protein
MGGTAAKPPKIRNPKSEVQKDGVVDVAGESRKRSNPYGLRAPRHQSFGFRISDFGFEASAS